MSAKQVHKQWYEVTCYGCNETFTWSTKESKGEPFPAFCSPMCKHNTGLRIALMGPRPCPTPKKKIWASQIDAHQEVSRIIRKNRADKTRLPNKSKTLDVYMCICGCLHIGNRQAKRIASQKSKGDSNA